VSVLLTHLLILCLLSGKCNASIVCDLSDIKFAVILSISSVTDISATVTPIGVTFCMMVYTGPGEVFSPFGRGTPKNPKNPKFWPSKKRISRKQ